MRSRRLSEEEALQREYYRKNVVDLVNHPADVQWFYLRETRVDELASSTRTGNVYSEFIQEDPEFPIPDIARAIKDVVAGEEDLDSLRYLRGAEFILRMDRKYCSWRPMSLSANSFDISPRTGRSLPRFDKDDTDEARPMPRLMFWPGLFEQDEDPSLGLRRSERRWDHSGIIFSLFRDYLEHYHRVFHLGVCHEKSCDRLYIKAKGKPNQRYCSATCRERARHLRRKATATDQ